MSTTHPQPEAQAPEDGLQEFRFRVEDFCYNRRTVTVHARSRDHASEKLAEETAAPISAAWVPALGERAP